MTSEFYQQPSDEKPFDEVEVLQSILSSLRNLPKEARERIIQTILTFFDIGSATFSTQPSINRQSTVDKILPAFSEDRNISPKEFLMEKFPQTDVERVACLAYYLNHYKDMPHFKTIDISKLNTEAAQRKFANATKAVNNATNYGYLAPATKGQKQLSAAGELFVQALPDRLAAKEAMTHARPRRKPKVANKKKKATGEK